jgi:hypothetical protein
MNTKELYERKQKLASDISNAVSVLYNDFVNETGEYPSYISLNLIDTTTVGDSKRTNAIGNTDIDIRI